MTISPETMRILRLRAGGKCECTMAECSHHVGRCNVQLGENWHAYPGSRSGADDLGNLIAMCQTCYRTTEHMADSNQK